MIRAIIFLAMFFVHSNLSSIETVFPFSNAPIDVVIPCVEKDVLTLNLCIRGIRENGINIRRIIVVSNKKLTDEAEWFNESNYPFSFQDVIDNLANTASSLIEKKSRGGWYYQQLLKLYAPLVIPDISPNVLVLDADAIFLNTVTFLNENNGGMYNPEIEHHPPYFEHAKRLIPGFYKCFPKYSGISHHMIFQKPVIEALFKEVEDYHNLLFWESFCRLVEEKNIPFSGASEYEIYFNYIFARTNQVSIRKLQSKNLQKLSEVDAFRKTKLDYICLHAYDRVE